MRGAAHPSAGVSFDDLYRVHAAPVARWLRRLAVPEHEIEDLRQEVFLVAFRRQGDFRGESAVATWLWGITFNVARSRRRQAARRISLETRATAETDGPAHDTLEMLCRAEDRAMVRNAVETLNSRDRELIRLCVLEERSGAEVAQLMGATRNTVQVGVHRARARLTRLLESASEGRGRAKSVLLALLAASMVVGTTWAAQYLLQRLSASTSTAPAPARGAVPEASAEPVREFGVSGPRLELLGTEPAALGPAPSRPKPETRPRPAQQVQALADTPPRVRDPLAVLEQVLEARRDGDFVVMRAILLEHRAELEHGGFAKEASELAAVATLGLREASSAGLPESADQ